MNSPLAGSPFFCRVFAVLLLPPLMAMSHSLAPTAEPVWRTLGALPEPVGGGACAVWGTRIVTAGGTNWPGGQKVWVRKIRVFDIESSTWSELPEMPLPWAYGVHGARGDMLFMAGGGDGSKTHRGLWRFSFLPQGRLEEVAGTSIAAASAYATGGVLGEELVLAGGTPDVNDLGGLCSRVSAVHLQTGVVRHLPPMPGPATGIAASAVSGGSLYVFGGARWDAASKTVVNLAETRIFSSQREAWSRGASLPFEARGLVAVTLDERHIYVGGGFRTSPEGFSDAAFIYDAQGDRFEPAPRLPLAGMTSLVTAGGWVYCLGGEDGKQHRSDGFWRAAVGDLLKAPDGR